MEELQQLGFSEVDAPPLLRARIIGIRILEELRIAPDMKQCKLLNPDEIEDLEEGKRARIDFKVASLLLDKGVVELTPEQFINNHSE